MILSMAELGKKVLLKLSPLEGKDDLKQSHSNQAREKEKVQKKK